LLALLAEACEQTGHASEGCAALEEPLTSHAQVIIKGRRAQQV
jgi:hypothetical protein